MTRSASAPEARALLFAAQRLSDEARARRASVAEVVREVCALQAQDEPAASLAVRARLAGSSHSAVRAAVEQERSVVRAWLMRGTLHYVCAEDHGWLLALLGPRALARSRRRRAELGADGAELLRAVGVVLAEGPLTRHELAAAVARSGVRLANDPQAPVHVAMYACLASVAIECGRRGREPLYCLWQDWLGGAASGPADPLGELSRRYLRAFAPAASEDLAHWSGLPVGACRTGFDALGALEELEVQGRRLFRLRGESPELDPLPHVRVLGAFDGVLLGHRDRLLIVPARDESALHPRGGMVAPAVMVDGVVAATWRHGRSGFEAAWLEQPSARTLAAAEEEAADIARHRAA